MTKRKPFTHHCKSHIEFYADIISRRVDYDLRKDDREPPYDVGDTIVLHEHSIIKDAPTGHKCRVLITSAKRSRPGLKTGYVGLGLKLISGAPLGATEHKHMGGLGE